MAKISIQIQILSQEMRELGAIVNGTYDDGSGNLQPLYDTTDGFDIAFTGKLSKLRVVFVPTVQTLPA